MWPQCQRHLPSKILRIRPSGQAAKRKREKEKQKENGRRMETLQHMCRGSACIREYRVRHKKQACQDGEAALDNYSSIFMSPQEDATRRQHRVCVCSASPPGWRGDSHRKHVLASVLTTGEPRKKTCLSILMKFSIQG